MPSRYARLAFVGAFLLVASGFTCCTSSTTSVTAPTAAKCQVSASNAPTSFTATGGSGAVTVAAARDCTWSISADAPWIAVRGPNSGQGEATVSYSVQANPAPLPRTGSITVNGQRLAVTEAGAPCQFSIARTGASIGADGGQLSVDVSTQSGCGWTASSGVAWITIRSGASGNASGTVVLAVAPNNGADRVGSVNVAGQTYTVTQASRSATSPTPPPSSVDFSGSISGLIGLCPSVVFHIKDLTIATSDATTYRHGTCGDLSGGTQVSGSGLTQPDGSVLASSIDVIKKD